MGVLLRQQVLYLMALFIIISNGSMVPDGKNKPSCPDDNISRIRPSCHVMDEVRQAIQ